MPKTEWDSIDAAARARAAWLQQEAEALRRRAAANPMIADDGFEEGDELTVDDSRDKEK